MKKCPRCHQQVQLGKSRCPNCGYDFVTHIQNKVPKDLGLMGFKIKPKTKKAKKKTKPPENKPMTKRSVKAVNKPVKNTKNKKLWPLFLVLVLALVFIGIYASHLHKPAKPNEVQTTQTSEKISSSSSLKQEIKKSSSSSKSTKKIKKSKPVKIIPLKFFLINVFSKPKAKYFTKGSQSHDYHALLGVNSNWDTSDVRIRIKIISKKATNKRLYLNYLVYYNFKTGVKQVMEYQNAIIMRKRISYQISYLGAGTLIEQRTYSTIKNLK